MLAFAMTKDAKRRSSSMPGNKDREPRRRSSGGAAAAGGFNFQAAVTAIAEVCVARGAPLGWLDGLVDDTPISVAAETGGPGDDIRLIFKGGEVAEVQVKRGLQAGTDQRESLAKLANSIHAGDIDFGLLVVCPTCSRTISVGLAQDLVRIGEGAETELGDLGADFRKELEERAFDAAAVCARLRIVSVHALAADDSSVRAAHSELAHLCRYADDVRAAWDRLYRDAHLMIEFRGVRRSGAIFRLLLSSGLELAADISHKPAGMLTHLCSWIARVNDSFSIIGVRRSLLFDEAWIEMTLVVRAATEPEVTDLRSALDRYHHWGERARPQESISCAADTLGQFYRLVVVVGGPGMGKSTLLKRLARRYAAEGYPVVRVSAKAAESFVNANGSDWSKSSAAVECLRPW